MALSCIARSKTFDNGTVCASEQSIIVEAAMERQVQETADEIRTEIEGGNET